MPESPTPELTVEEFHRLRHGVRLFALHELGDADSADEVAQETVARVVDAMRDGRIRDRHKLGAFARSIAHHVIVDVIRRHRRERSLEASPSEVHATAVPDPLATLVTAEQRDAVHAALNLLTDADREILRLSFFDGITSEEIAQRLGQPAPRVRKRKERALERLRHAFAEKHRHISIPASTHSSAERRLVSAPTLRAE